MGEGGSSDVEFAFFVAKNFEFFETYGVSARTSGERVDPVRTIFRQQRRGKFFAIFSGRTSFMKGP